MTGMAGITLGIAIMVVGLFLAIVTLQFSTDTLTDSHETFLADLVATGTTAIALPGDAAGLAMPGNLGFHAKPGQIVFALTELLELPFVTLATGLRRGHLRLVEIRHAEVQVTMTVRAANVFLIFLGIGHGTGKVLLDDARGYIDVTANAFSILAVVIVTGTDDGTGRAVQEYKQDTGDEDTSKSITTHDIFSSPRLAGTERLLPAIVVMIS
jgi:hypothetical protein